MPSDVNDEHAKRNVGALIMCVIGLLVSFIMLMFAIANAIVIFMFLESPELLQFTGPILRSLYCLMLVIEMALLLVGPLDYRKSLLGTLIAEFGFVTVLVELLITIVLTIYMPSIELVLAVMLRIAVLFLWALLICVFFNYDWPSMRPLQPYPPEAQAFDDF